MGVIKSLRKWQQAAVSKLSGHRYSMLKAVTGAGKSVVIAKLAHNFWAGNHSRKTIVAVPSTAIGSNFKDVIFAEDNIHFTPSEKNYLIGTIAENKKVDALKNFLLSKDKSFEGNICICTHKTLQKASEQFPELFQDCFLVPDEFHHSRAGNDDSGYNKTGRCIETLASNPSNHILMVTATPFRTDNAELFPESFKDKIESYSYNLSQYLADCEFLEEVRYESHWYNHVSSYHPALQEYLQINGVQKSILFLPTNVRLSERRAHVCMVMAAALQMPARDDSGKLYLEDELKHPEVGPFRRINEGELFYEYQNQETGRILRIIDLDDDNNVREERLNWLHQNRDADANCDYLLISLQVFIEGGDFPAINRVINLSVDKSFLRMIQKWGRATRDYKGKKIATFVQFMNINDGYNLANADSYSENQLDEIIDLQEMDLDEIELQRLAEIRGRMYATKRPTVAVPTDTDTGEVIVSDDKKVEEDLSLVGFLKNNWVRILAACLLGTAVGLLVEQGTKEYAKKDGQTVEVQYQELSK